MIFSNGYLSLYRFHYGPHVLNILATNPNQHRNGYRTLDLKLLFLVISRRGLDFLQVFHNRHSSPCAAVSVERFLVRSRLESRIPRCESIFGSPVGVRLSLHVGGARRRSRGPDWSTSKEEVATETSRHRQAAATAWHGVQYWQRQCIEAPWRRVDESSCICFAVLFLITSIMTFNAKWCLSRFRRSFNVL